jgi:hypothetical protein
MTQSRLKYSVSEPGCIVRLSHPCTTLPRGEHSPPGFSSLLAFASLQCCPAGCSFPTAPGCRPYPKQIIHYQTNHWHHQRFTMKLKYNIRRKILCRFTTHRNEKFTTHQPNSSQILNMIAMRSSQHINDLQTSQTSQCVSRTSELINKKLLDT